MKIKQSKWFPFGNFYAINWFGTIYYKSEDSLTLSTYNHERIHDAQAMDFCKWRIPAYLIYYLIYVLCWLIELVRPPFNRAYRDICFEKEAKENQYDSSYLSKRKRFAGLNKIYWINKK